MAAINVVLFRAMHRRTGVHRTSLITRRALLASPLEERLQMECRDKMSLPPFVD
jgi:hypothetical protein